MHESVGKNWQNWSTAEKKKKTDIGVSTLSLEKCEESGEAWKRQRKDRIPEHRSFALRYNWLREKENLHCFAQWSEWFKEVGEDEEGSLNYHSDSGRNKGSVDWSENTRLPKIRNKKFTTADRTHRTINVWTTTVTLTTHESHESGKTRWAEREIKI